MFPFEGRQFSSPNGANPSTLRRHAESHTKTVPLCRVTVSLEVILLGVLKASTDSPSFELLKLSILINLDGHHAVAILIEAPR